MTLIPKPKSTTTCICYNNAHKTLQATAPLISCKSMKVGTYVCKTKSHCNFDEAFKFLRRLTRTLFIIINTNSTGDKTTCTANQLQSL